MTRRLATVLEVSATLAGRVQDVIKVSRYNVKLRSQSNILLYSKTCLKRPLKEITKIGFQDQLSLNAGEKYCRMLQWEHSAIFQPSLSYHLSLRSMFCLFLSDRLRQVLQYMKCQNN